jgi:hypothetical protein
MSRLSATLFMSNRCTHHDSTYPEVEGKAHWARREATALSPRTESAPEAAKK